MKSSSVLSDAFWPGFSLLKETVLVITGTLLVAFLAKIQIPLEPVPITGQTLGVLLIGAVLGSKRGALSMVFYLTLGAAGLPVFAGFFPGIVALTGPTAGYLIGFIPAAFLVGWFSEQGWSRTIPAALLSMVTGTLLIYISGCVWLARFIGWNQVLPLGVAPFLIGDALKIVLATFLLPGGWKLTGKLPN